VAARLFLKREDAIMESMTSYAAIEKSTEQFSYSVEVRSLNSKYLEVNVNLPKILRGDENEYIQLIKERFTRGKLELNIDVFDWIESRSVTVNTALMKKYYVELEQAKKKLGIANPLSFDILVTLDGVLQRQRSQLSEKSQRDIFRTLNMVIRKNLEMRKREGRSIKSDIQKSLKNISNCVGEIRAQSRNTAEALYEKLKTNIQKLTDGPVDDVRLYTEIAILADKVDVNEELIRLDDHLSKFKQTMNEKGQVGKKLDFLAQEMFREINTIASKSNNARISHLVVEVKNNVDKIREHCRNIV
jgi:uncharacterized protein (TIGR00255 family)